jgi:2',3'-cyclic-nucleotide 2'-phosphodiesterase/3'-nucleotidase
MVIPEGDVLVRDLFDICPNETMLNVMMLTGQEVKDYLEYSYAQWVGGMTSA